MKIDVALSFRLIRPEIIQQSYCIVIDIFRATSTMCVAFANGCKEIRPVSTIEECYNTKKDGYILVGEREGLDIEGFDYNNSPTTLSSVNLTEKKICMTTMNGTLAINAVSQSKGIVIGSFLNISSVLSHIQENSFESVVCVCGGNNGGWNMCGADTLFAGAIVNRVRDFGYSLATDNAMIAENFYQQNKDDKARFIEQSSFKKQFSNSKLHLKDAEFCLQEDLYSCLPIWDGQKLKVSVK